MMRRAIAGLAFLPLLACSDSTGPAAGTPVELRFGVLSDAATSAMPAGAAYDVLPTASLALPAEGGTYEIDDVEVIASHFELEGMDGCGSTSTSEMGGENEGEDMDCEFEGAPMLLDLPLDGGTLSLATDPFPDGTYTTVKFKVEDLDLSDDEDGGDAAKQQAVADIMTQLESVYPDFPANASMVVHGQFVPTSGDPQEFTVYFAAEIEIHMPIDPPLVVPGDAALTVNVDPGAWLAGLDLVALNGQTVEFELEMEHGFHHTEVEHDD